jgi:hypothetical protein
MRKKSTIEETFFGSVGLFREAANQLDAIAYYLKATSDVLKDTFDQFAASKPKGKPKGKPRR